MSVVTWMSVVGLEINKMDGCFFCKEVFFFFITQLCFVGCNIENFLGKHPVHTYIYSCMCTDPLLARTHARTSFPAFIHAAINHFWFSQWLTTRTQMLFLAVTFCCEMQSILTLHIFSALWLSVSSLSQKPNLRLHFFLGAARQTRHSASPSVLSHIETGNQKDVLWQRFYVFGNILPLLLPNGTFVVSSVNWKLAPVSEPWRQKSQGSTYLKWLRRIC